MINHPKADCAECGQFDEVFKFRGKVICRDCMCPPIEDCAVNHSRTGLSSLHPGDNETLTEKRPFKRRIRAKKK